MKIEPSPERLLRRLTLERNGVPIYVQIRDQVLQAVRGGVIGSGERLPTLRQVAVALRVDLNTVRHAYDELERMGALTLERGRGSFVSDRMGDPGGGSDRARALAAEVLTQAKAAGVDPAGLMEALASLLKEGRSQ